MWSIAVDAPKRPFLFGHWYLLCFKVQLGQDGRIEGVSHIDYSHGIFGRSYTGV